MDIQKTHMNKNISFLRIRPCYNNNEIYLNSRRKEGTSAFLIKSELDLDISEIHKKDFCMYFFITFSNILSAVIGSHLTKVEFNENPLEDEVFGLR